MSLKEFIFGCVTKKLTGTRKERIHRLFLAGVFIKNDEV